MKNSFIPKKIILFCVIYFLLLLNPSIALASNDQAILAGGCFWCLEHDLESLNGVLNAESGYSGGNLINPTYKKHQGHQESVLVTFDSETISYEELLDNYWKNIDPFDGKGQFCDRGESYKPVIFTMNNNQANVANLSIQKTAQELAVSEDSIAVKILPAKKFWLAEEYHQNYADRNNIKYNYYRYLCGRDKRLEDVWGGV